EPVITSRRPFPSAERPPALSGFRRHRYVGARPCWRRIPFVAACGGGAGLFRKMCVMLKVSLPDGSVKEFSSSTTTRAIAEGIGPRLAKAALAAEVDGKVVGLDTHLPETGDIKLRLLTRKDAEALAVMRHSCAHVMARAVMRLKKGVQLAFGPTVE